MIESNIINWIDLGDSMQSLDVYGKKKWVKFDYRLFAYKPEISDSVIIHEIAHTYEIHHNDHFYKIVHRFCPDYDYLQDELEKGHFEGELDNYVY